jgi:hypothetical protein
MSEDDELGSFEEFQGGSPDSEEDPDTTDEAQNATDDEPAEAFDPTDNPLGLDPRPGKWDLCFDRAKPGAKVYVVDVLAESVEDYQENYPDAPELDTFEGNVVVRMRPEDRVLAAIYVDQSLTSTPDTAYPMPESRLTRVPAEEASLIGNSTVEFDRPPVDGHRLSGADPETVPDDAERDDDGEAVLTEDA